MVLTLSRKLPLSPYEMFSVVPSGGEVSHKADVNLLVQTPLVGTCIVGERLVGRLGAAQTAYNPFTLYGSAEGGRHKDRPPHIVFAELEDTRQDACAFLNAFGPLLMEYAVLDSNELSEWKKASAGSPDPAEFFEEVGIKAQIPPRPQRCSAAFYECDLEQFQKLRSEYELTFRLALALQKADARTSAIKSAVKNAGLEWKESGERLLQKAIDHVRGTINDNLDLSSPRVVRTIDRRSVEGVWGCYSLLASLYLMLFLDLVGHAHTVVACQKCGKTFYADRPRVSYCSALCENRARSLRAYYKKTRRKG